MNFDYENLQLDAYNDIRIQKTFMWWINAAMINIDRK